MDSLLKQLEQLKRLDNPPSTQACSLAARALAVCWRYDLHPMKLLPSPTQGVMLLFWDGSVYGDLEITKSGMISIVFSTMLSQNNTILERSPANTVDKALYAAACRFGTLKSLSIVDEKKLDTDGFSV